MLQQILDNIEGILVELMDNQIDFDFDVKDKRDKFLRFDIRFFPEFIRGGGLSRYFPYLEFYGRDGKLKPYIKEALLTLDTYLKSKLMYVKVHSLFGNEGIMMSIPEFTKIEGSMATSIKMFTIGVSVNHLARGKANRDIKEKIINSYSEFINESFDKNSIKDFCERYLAYLLDDENYSIELTVPRRGGTSFWTNSEGPQIAISKKGDLIRWNDVKDHMIPFLTILNKEYNCFPDIDFKIGSNFVYTTLVTHRMPDLIKDFAITHRPFNKIVISLRSNQNKFRAKRFLTEELKDITKNKSKRFNESVNEYDLKDYCETNLAYLMDDGLKVEPDFYNGSEYNELDELSVLLSWGGHRRKWSEIKDHIIPFLHRLRNEYELDEVYFGNDPDTAEYRNKFFRFSVKDWHKPTVNGIGYNKETHLSYDELETLPDETFINKIIFWVKI
jgi:hypothetical protein